LRKSTVVCALLLAGCNRHQSALAPFGLEARSTLAMIMALVIDAVVDARKPRQPMVVIARRIPAEDIEQLAKALSRRAP
jgi:hypothetical protein